MVCLIFVWEVRRSIVLSCFRECVIIDWGRPSFLRWKQLVAAKSVSSYKIFSSSGIPAYLAASFSVIWSSGSSPLPSASSEAARHGLLEVVGMLLVLQAETPGASGTQVSTLVHEGLLSLFF